jgi:hypothetical protein
MNITIQEKYTSSNKKIYIIDNAFLYTDAISFEIFANNCHYKLLSSIPVNLSRSNNERFFGSVLNSMDVDNLGIFNTSRFKEISYIFNDMKIDRSWILCTTPSTKYLYHADDNRNSLTFLYYLNSYWHPEWGGETLFCNENGEPDLAVACKPNRLVICPSEVHHKPYLITSDARMRFTFSTTFVNESV